MYSTYYHIPYQNGELVVSLDENHRAILCDYIGGAKVLYLPASVSIVDEDGNTDLYDVSHLVPDMSFGSCSNVEIIICGLNTQFEFGCFTFLHCNNLHSIVFLSLHDKDVTNADIDEFSFADENYVPKTLRKHMLLLGDEWDYYHHHELLLNEPQDPGYDKATYEYADYLGYMFSFMDWLETALPSLITNNAVNPELLLLFIKRYGQCDCSECRDSSGKTKIYYAADAPTLTRRIPQYNESEWVLWDIEQRKNEYTYWINLVIKYFSSYGVSNDLLFENENNKAIITGYIGSKKNLEIPRILNGMIVVSISQMAFSFNRHLDAISLPDSLRTIEAGAFQGCDGLQTMVIPKEVTCISEDSFKDCKELKEVFLPEGATVIQMGSFQNCEHLVRVSIPESVRDIGPMAFSGCKSLPSVFIPHGITRIADWAFSGCERLLMVVLPNTIQSIGVCAFSGCKCLSSVRIPDSVIEIAGTAFNGCQNITIIASEDSYAASFAQPSMPNPFLNCNFKSASKTNEGVKKLAEMLQDLLDNNPGT